MKYHIIRSTPFGFPLLALDHESAFEVWWWRRLVLYRNDLQDQIDDLDCCTVLGPWWTRSCSVIKKIKINKRQSVIAIKKRIISFSSIEGLGRWCAAMSPSLETSCPSWVVSAVRLLFFGWNGGEVWFEDGRQHGPQQVFYGYPVHDWSHAHSAIYLSWLSILALYVYVHPASYSTVRGQWRVVTDTPKVFLLTKKTRDYVT